LRYLRYLLLFIVTAAAVILSIANRAPVVLHLLPEGEVSNGLLSGASNELTLPIYIVVLAAVFVGMVLGLVLEMLRETGHRREERRYKREAAALLKDNQRLRKLVGEEEDDLLGPA
jgi:putative membrane protein